MTGDTVIHRDYAGTERVAFILADYDTTAQLYVLPTGPADAIPFGLPMVLLPGAPMLNAGMPVYQFADELGVISGFDGFYRRTP